VADQATPARRSFGARLRSVRARATLVSVVVVGAAMAVGAVALVSILHTSMQEGVETTARAQLTDVASLLRFGQLPYQLPAGRDGTFTQVVDAKGRVLATTASLLGTTPISRLHPGEEGIKIDTIPSLSEGGPGETDPEGPYLLLAESVPASPSAVAVTGPQVTVYVASSLRPVVRATALVGLSLVIGLPVLVLLVGTLVWIFGGRALRPVEAIRAEVADISGHDLHRRVPVPATADEVARLAQTMNGMLDRLEASADAQRRFVADASHELRSPLAVLQATLEVALAHPENSTWPAVASDALDEARRLQRLVEDLLMLARTEAVPNRADWQSVDLDDLVLAEARRRRATGDGTRFDLSRLSGGRVQGDAGQLSRVVHNLMDNAQRHAATTVTVECSSANGHVLVAVADDGPGISPTERERIFERFARVDEARTEDDGGSGLGLAIAKEIVDAHDGTIVVADSPIGARFEVRLPAADGDESDDDGG
jgi:signal transduction histidine kinase